MSLDVWLKVPIGYQKEGEQVSKIWIRENGQNKEISREEWDRRFPGIEPIAVVYEGDRDTTEVFEWNITHNLNTMAGEAGIYEHLWRPDELGIDTAGQLIEPLTKGLELLQSDPARFEKFNPSNGWGDYDGLVTFVAKYLQACKDYPEAKIGISR